MDRKKVSTFAPAKLKGDALVAQLVEHLTLNQGVQGSSPCRRTKQDNLNSEVVLFCIFTFHEIPKS